MINFVRGYRTVAARTSEGPTQCHDRAAQQRRALTALSGSTWGASFAKARLIYSAVVRPCLTYGTTIWAPLEGTLRLAK